MVWKTKRRSKEMQSRSCLPRRMDDSHLKSCLKRSSAGMVSSTTPGTEPAANSSDRRLPASLISDSCSEHSNKPPLCWSSSSRRSAEGGSRTSDSDSSKIQSLSLGSERYSSKTDTLSSGCSRRKAVRFDEVHIREYERTLGDNPSCSSGPPIGIGWGYGTTNVVCINQYEDDRQYRRPQLEMVLSREERFELLQEWTIPQDAVIQATRDNLKAKFQRRRTVRNASKVEKLEIAFEGAAKSLKRAFHLRKRTSDEMKDLQRQANLASQALDAARVSAYHDLSEPIVDHRVVGISEPDDDEDAWKNISGVASSSLFAGEAMDDSATAVSCITFDSATSSMMDIEEFYRDLELEMFGADDDETSSIPPHTLEVHGSAKSQNTAETGLATEDVSSSSSTPSFLSFANTEVRQFHSFEMGIPTTPQHQVTENQMPLDYRGGSQAQTHNVQYNPYARTSAYRGYSLRDAYRGNQCAAFGTFMVPPSSANTGGMGYEESREISMPNQNNAWRSAHRSPFLQHDWFNALSSSDANEGPTITMLPYSTANTGRKWVEDHDHHEPVTISEEQGYDSGQGLLGPTARGSWLF